MLDLHIFLDVTLSVWMHVDLEHEDLGLVSPLVHDLVCTLSTHLDLVPVGERGADVIVFHHFVSQGHALTALDQEVG